MTGCILKSLGFWVWASWILTNNGKQSRNGGNLIKIDDSGNKECGVTLHWQQKNILWSKLKLFFWEVSVVPMLQQCMQPLVHTLYHPKCRLFNVFFPSFWFKLLQGGDERITCSTPPWQVFSMDVPPPRYSRPLRALCCPSASWSSWPDCWAERRPLDWYPSPPATNTHRKTHKY